MVQVLRVKALRNGKRNMVAARYLRYTSTSHRNPEAAFLEKMPIACLGRFTVTGVRGPFVETKITPASEGHGVWEDRACTVEEVAAVAQVVQALTSRLWQLIVSTT